MSWPPSRATVAVIGATFCMNVGLAAVAAGAPVVQQACGHSERLIAIAAALSSAAAVSGALLAGRGLLGGRRGWLLAMLVLLMGAIGSVVGADPQAASLSLLLVPLRLLDGLALGAALVASETLLLAGTPDARRGHALALYGMATAAGFITGPTLASLGIAHGGIGAAFVVAAGAAVVAGVIVALGVRDVATMQTATQKTQTTPQTKPQTTAWSLLWRRNVLPWSTTLHYGTFQGAALVLLPLRLLHDGIDEAGAVAIVAFYALGMLLCMYPTTRLGERFGALKVMAALCTIGGVAVLTLAVSSLTWLPVRGALAFVIGGTVATLSPLSLLLQSRANDAGDLARANALYNSCYAAGGLIGPVLVAVVIDVTGISPLLCVLGALWLLHAAWLLVASRLFVSSTSTSATHRPDDVAAAAPTLSPEPA